MSTDLSTLALEFWGWQKVEVAPSPTGNKKNYFANIATYDRRPICRYSFKKLKAYQTGI